MKTDKTQKKIVAVRLSMELYEEISALAEQNTRSVPNQIRQIVREYFAPRGEFLLGRPKRNQKDAGGRTGKATAAPCFPKCLPPDPRLRGRTE